MKKKIILITSIVVFALIALVVLLTVRACKQRTTIKTLEKVVTTEREINSDFTEIDKDANEIKESIPDTSTDNRIDIYTDILSNLKKDHSESSSN